MTERGMRFPRLDNGPTRVVGTYTVIEENREVKKKIRVYTGPRKALRCGQFG